jgi:hypothetical protein
MKKKLSMLSLLGGIAILIVGAVILSSCEGPAGANGTNGANGADGTAGQDGADGADANSTCILCHSDDQVIVTKSRQYANSAHSQGHVSGYTNRSFGPDYNCAGCHTSQGFVDLLVGASNTPYADVTQPNCYTCHSIHDTYTEADWALTHPDATDPMTGSTAVDIGNGNQCTQCHRAVEHYLAIDSLWADFDLGTTSVTLPADNSLKRAGVHHSPQYNLFVGMDLFEFSGTAYPTAVHPQNEAADGCVTCHMDDGFGDMTGHSMAITYEFHGADNFHWPASCLTCHVTDGGLDLDAVYERVTVEIQGLMDDLEAALLASGVMTADYYLAPGVWTTDLTAATVNFNAIREDKSVGFHNPKYIRTVLANSIAAIQ